MKVYSIKKHITFVLTFLMTLTTLIIVPTHHAYANSTDIYVATDGDDSHAGTLGEPLKTLEMAKAKVRAILPSASGPINVWIRGGTYYLTNTLTFTNEDSGTETNPVCYKAYNNEKVTISGGRLIDATWQDYAVNPNIKVANIGTGYQFDQLFVDGSLQVMARYPNYQPDEILGGYSSYNDCFATSRITGWSNPSTGYMRAIHANKWGGNSYKITGVNGTTVNLSWVGDNNRGSGYDASRVMVENIFEELDVAGEWFYNQSSGQLFYYPPTNITLSSAKIEVASLEELIRVEGNTNGAPVHYLTLDGINLAHVHRTLFTGKFDRLLRGDWCVVRKGAITMKNAEHITITNCNFDQLGGNGIFLDGYNNSHTISNNSFTNIGATAINVVGSPEAARNASYWPWPTNSPYYSEGGGHITNMNDTTPGPKTEDYPRNITIDHNYIYRVGEFEKQTAGVNISMSKQVTVSHNTIHRSPRSGININDGTWGGHIIEYNDVFDCVRETSDHGAFNSWGRDRFWSYLGFNTSGSNGALKRPYAFLDCIEKTIIRNNRFAMAKDTGWCIDLDDGSSNYDIYNNVCMNGGIKLRVGFDRNVYNNIIANDGGHFHVWYEQCGDIYEKNISAWNQTHSVIQLKTYYDYGNERIDNNLFYNPNGSVEVKPSNWISGFKYDQNATFNQNPLFTDITTNDYTVMPNSPALSLGFINFSMDQFGKPGSPTPEPIELLNGNIEADNTIWLGAKASNVYNESIKSATGLPDYNGLYLESLPTGSYATTMGFQDLDAIRKLNGTAIGNSIASFYSIYDLIPENGVVEVEIMRDQTLQNMTFIKPAMIVLNNNHGDITYEGSWNESVNRTYANDYNQDVHATTTNEDYFEYTFTGTGIEYITEKYHDMGNVEIFIDGIAIETVNCHTTGDRLSQQLVFTKTGLVNGTHTIKGVKKSGDFMLVDAFKIYSAIPTTTTMNNTYSGITYSGSWNISNNRPFNDYSKDVQYTETDQDYFEYSFTGTGIEYITEKYSDMGNVEIFIDGVSQGMINCYVPGNRLSQQVVFEKKDLPAGIHTIKGVKSSGQFMLVDAFKVHQ